MRVMAQIANDLSMGPKVQGEWTDLGREEFFLNDLEVIG